MPSFPNDFVLPSGEVIPRETGFALIGLRRPMPASEFRSRIASLKEMQILGLEDAASGQQPDYEVTPALTINNSTRHYWVQLPEGTGLTAETVHRQVAGVLGPDLDYVGPVYRVPSEPDEEPADTAAARLEGLVCPVPNLVLVRVRANRNDEFDARLAAADLPLDEIPEQATLTGGRLRLFRVRSLDATNAYVLRDRLRSGFDLLLESVQLQQVPLLKPVLYTPNDGQDLGQYYQQQWGLRVIKAEDAWDLSQGNSSTFICVIDDGVKLAHPDLQGNIAPGGGVDVGNPGSNADVVDATLEWHGTTIAGIAAAEMNNGQGIAGLAGRCAIYPVKFDFSDAEFIIALHHLIAFAAQAPNRRVVINMSFGWTDRQLRGLNRAEMDAAIADAHAANCLLCAGTGNGTGKKQPSYILYPSRHPSVMACGASAKDDYRCSSGNAGFESQYATGLHNGQRTGVSVVAPGLGIWCTLAGGGYGPRSGTSMATPHVAALGALIIARYGLTGDQARTVIEQTAEKVHATGAAPLYAYAHDNDFPDSTWTNEVGHGRIHAYNAMVAAAARTGLQLLETTVP